MSVSFYSLRMTTDAVSVLPSRNHVLPQATLPNGTLTVTVIGSPRLAVATLGVIVREKPLM